MQPSELAEALRPLTKFGLEARDSESVQDLQLLHYMHRMDILIFVQFAADMEVLASDPLFMMKTSIASGQVDILTSAGWVHGKDYYSAARKEVEALEDRDE